MKTYSRKRSKPIDTRITIVQRTLAHHARHPNDTTVHMTVESIKAFRSKYL
jgi:hypothetical protein